jgi:hypothetical protein
MKKWKERSSLGRFAEMSPVPTPSRQRQLSSMSTQSPPHHLLLNQKVHRNHSACSVKLGATGLNSAKEVTDVKDRTEKLKLASRCSLCLNRGHSLKNCSKKGKVYCSKCRKSHHYSTCNADQPVSTSVNQIDTQLRDFTARIWITGPLGLRSSRCLLDSGSQSSFIHASLIDQLQLSFVDKRDVIITPFESTAPTLLSRRLVQFTLQGIWAETTNRHVLRECAQYICHTQPFPTM